MNMQRGPLPQRALPPVIAVEVLDIALSEVAHESDACLRGGGGKEKVHVVRHQTVGVDIAPMPLGQLAEMKEIQ